jgi:hypothetical protein
MEKSTITFNQLTDHFLSNSSEINLFPIMYDQAKNEYFLNIFRCYVLNDAVQNNILFYLTHEVSDSDWLDTIATTYYGTPNLWWLVAMINNMMNPFEGLEPGTNLKILKSDYVYQILREMEMIASL